MPVYNLHYKERCARRVFKRCRRRRDRRLTKALLAGGRFDEVHSPKMTFRPQFP